MSNQKTFDPYAIWQDYYKNFESFWGQTMDEKMKTEEFSEWLGGILKTNLLYKEMADTSAKQYLEVLNIPSREDLASVSTLIINLDSKVDELDERLEENIENQPSPTTMRRDMTQLKRDVKDLGKKLDEVLKAMKDTEKTNKSGKK